MTSRKQIGIWKQQTSHYKRRHFSLGSSVSNISFLCFAFSWLPRSVFRNFVHFSVFFFLMIYWQLMGADVFVSVYFRYYFLASCWHGSYTMASRLRCVQYSSPGQRHWVNNGSTLALGHCTVWSHTPRVWMRDARHVCVQCIGDIGSHMALFEFVNICCNLSEYKQNCARHNYMLTTVCRRTQCYTNTIQH